MGNIKVGGHIIETSNEDKILFPSSKITKSDLINYYHKVGKLMLPYVKDRPISMVRYPSGVDKEGFFQKEAGEYFPSWIKTKKIKNKQIKGSTNYVVINNVATLVYLANQACIAPHIWLSKIDKINYPDKIVFDLDPAGKDFSMVQDGAMIIKTAVEKFNLMSYVMTTGSKGVHVVIPIKRVHTFDFVHNFTNELAKYLVENNKNLFTLEMRKNKRKKLVFIDFLRNAFGQTSVAPYAVRARKIPGVATPISWKELQSSSLKPNKYTIKNIFKHLDKNEDPWKNMLKSAKAIKI